MTFGRKDLSAEIKSQNDLKVIKMDIAKFLVHKVLIDNGSSVDMIIFIDVLKKMGLEDTCLNPVQTPLVGFGGSEVTSLRTIVLPMSIGEGPKRRTTGIRFLTSTILYGHSHPGSSFPTHLDTSTF
ncbi:UNVERIFIED_CONTAM: hypothetical protein Sindi_2241600 [Sesamum indicum]